MQGKIKVAICECLDTNTKEFELVKTKYKRESTLKKEMKNKNLLLVSFTIKEENYYINDDEIIEKYLINESEEK